MHDKAAKCVNWRRIHSIKCSLNISSGLWAAGTQAHDRPWLCRNIPRREFGSTLQDSCTEKTTWQPSLVRPPREWEQDLCPSLCSLLPSALQVSNGPCYGWVAYFSSHLLYLGCTAAEERFRKQFTGDLHVKPQNPVRMIGVCLPCSHHSVQR